ncbi:MAG: DNA-protecting protein DprA [Deltaproteobacteria bacterium]|nr:DNA-protecting protein DprA [Deltaproteobacteria bacterium]
MDGKSLKYWLALSRVRGIGQFDLNGVMERFGSPEEIFTAPGRILEAFSSVFAGAVKEFSAWEWAERELGLIDERKVTVVTFMDPRFPPLLRQICDPPCLLYMKGAGCDFGAPAVAVVGTRRPSHYGLRMAEDIAKGLASAGVTVVSGMARGCDTAAHNGAIASGGATVAILGTGVDVAYPKENGKLYDMIRGKGALISEFPLATPPLPHNFLMRNRIISGLSLGVVVVEAPRRSGALMTARLALEYNREVMAVPGQATSLKSAGTNGLIRDGAQLVESASDVLKALAIPFSAAPLEKERPRVGGEEGEVLKAIGDDPAHIDMITERTGFPAARISSILLGMEIKGMVKQLPGKRFLRRV